MGWPANATELPRPKIAVTGVFQSERTATARGLLEGEKKAVLCREFDVARKTGYKVFSPTGIVVLEIQLAASSSGSAATVPRHTRRSHSSCVPRSPGHARNCNSCSASSSFGYRRSRALTAS